MTNMAICCRRLDSSSCRAFSLLAAWGSEVMETEEIMVEFIRGMSSGRTVNKSSPGSPSPSSSPYTLSSSVSLSPSSLLALFKNWAMKSCMSKMEQFLHFLWRNIRASVETWIEWGCCLGLPPPIVDPPLRWRWYTEKGRRSRCPSYPVSAVGVESSVATRTETAIQIKLEFKILKFELWTFQNLMASSVDKEICMFMCWIQN